MAPQVHHPGRYTVEQTGYDRRSRKRFNIPMEATLIVRRKRLVQVSGFAKLVDISSCGVAFTTDMALLVGESVTMILEWPARLDDGCPLRMKVSGRVMRTQENGITAVQIQVHEIRTSSRERGILLA